MSRGLKRFILMEGKDKKKKGSIYTEKKKSVEKVSEIKRKKEKALNGFLS